MRVDRKKLASAMIDSDMNAICLSKRSGVSRVTISNMRCGKSCSESTINKIAQALGVDVRDLKEDLEAKKE